MYKVIKKVTYNVVDEKTYTKIREDISTVTEAETLAAALNNQQMVYEEKLREQKESFNAHVAN